MSTARISSPTPSFASCGRSPALLLAALVAVLAAACGSQAVTIPETNIPDTPANRQIIETVERYRVAVESKDIAALLLMASEGYREDAGTPSGRDDYGYEGLREVLQTRFKKATDIRYALRYVSVYRRCKQGNDPASNDGCRAYVDVLIDASFSIDSSTGGTMRPDMRDQNQLVLEWNGDRWLFLSGM